MPGFFRKVLISLSNILLISLIVTIRTKNPTVIKYHINIAHNSNLLPSLSKMKIKI